MPTRKSAAQRVVDLHAYSDAIPVNPLVEMRLEHEDWAQLDMARHLGVSKMVVCQAEDGMFSLIPTCYRLKIKNIMTVNAEYQAHRQAKREFFFQADMFPDAPAKRKPMLALINWFDLTPYKFGTRACVAHADIWKMSTTKRMMTQGLYEFLTQVGIDEKWIRQFNDGLRHNAPSPVTLSTPD